MSFLAHLHFALRSLRRTPLFTSAAVASLTLGVATCTVVFSLVNAAILRPPPFDDADRLTVLNVTQQTPTAGEFRLRWSWRQFQLLRTIVQSYEGIASVSNNVVTITGVDDPEPLPVELVSADYLTVMRAPLVLGRGFDDAVDYSASVSPVVVLGYDLWQRRFGGASDVLGRVVHVNGVGVTVIGVTAPGFAGLSGLAHAWIPATLAPRITYVDYLTTNQNFITVVGRLRPGVGIGAARAELAIVGELIHAREPSEADTREDRFSATAATLNEARLDIVTRRALLLLSGAVGVLLLISCANVASLLLGRGVQRRREIAIRIATGADRGTVVRQLLVESGVIAGLSGVLGLVFASVVIDILRIPPTLSRGRNFYGAVGEFATPAIDWHVVAFTAAVCACTTLLFGLVPALRATRTDLVTDLKAGRADAPTGRRRFGLREFAVAAQIAFALVLLVSCGLLLTSYSRLRDTRLGFDPVNLLTFMIRPSEVKYPSDLAPELLERVLESIAAVPGVRAATVDGCAPLSTQCANATLHIVGRPWADPASAPAVMRHYVAPQHFETLGVPLVRGRVLDPSDRAGRPRVVVINEAAAARFWPDQDPLGQRVWFEGPPAFGSPDSSAEVVGIVRNVAYQPLDEQPIQPGFFTPFAQFTYPARMVLVRTDGDPMALVPTVATAVRRADPDLALFDIQTMQQRARLSWAKLAFQTELFVVIGLIALSLAVTGVYAVTSAFVSARTREIGIRIAVGANALQVTRDATASAVRLGLAGGAAGLGGALVVSRIMRATLYETSPVDVSVYAAAGAVLTTAFIAATYVPVRRALRVNPVDLLRID
ncbi:MAG TPA: ABC transporter permease [Longimicrobiales bacterium]|nr:ABC transporter permease [Longimicrobiales bacterium]